MTEAKKRPRTPAQAAAEKKYAAVNRKTVTLALNRHTDADIIARFEEVAQRGDGVQAYIRTCIRAAIARGE